MTAINPDEFFSSAKESVEQEQKEHDALSEVDAWEPKPNPSTLRGYFMKAERIVTQHGPRYKVFLKDYDTEVTVSVFCGPKLLREGILEASPKPGTLIMFEYTGEHESQRGFKYGGYYIRAAESDEEYWKKITTPRPGEIEEYEARRVRNESASQSFSSSQAQEDPY